jgi:16S rRNA (cytosine967-C5)-methyltransferase
VIAPARRAAFDALVSVARRRRDLPDAIAEARERLADERDRGLLVELASGTLRLQAAIDHVLARVSRRPLARLDLEVLVALRLAAYQLLYLDRLPASAVVDDAVSLVKAARKTSAAGFVNAALRALSRTRHTIEWPARPAASDRDRGRQLEYLSVTLSHPRWIAERWLDREGFDGASAWMAFDNRPAPLTLRANTLRIGRAALAARLADDGIETTPTRFAPDGLIVERGHPLRLPWADEGWFVAQDEGSQLIALLAGIQSGERVLDACAAPGGKTLILAAGAGASGLVVAADVRERRVALLASTLSRAGATRVAVVHADAAAALPFAAAFDAVLVDAPCSGLGVLRREPDIRWRRGVDDLPGFARVQRAILRNAVSVVRPGGRLVYATCSSEPEENEDVVRAVLDELGGEDRLRCSPAPAGLVRSALPEAARGLVDDSGAFRSLPWRDGLEGFCATVLVRNG